jgi:hypothetical protein
VIVRFVGGPWDGELRELPRNTWRLRVPTHRPSDHMSVLRYNPEAAALPVPHAVGEYVFSMESYMMHWQEPR